MRDGGELPIPPNRRQHGPHDTGKSTTLTTKPQYLIPKALSLAKRAHDEAVRRLMQGKNEAAIPTYGNAWLKW